MSRFLIGLGAVLLFIFSPAPSAAQENYEDAYNRTYQENIGKEYLNGVYIPKDISEALDELDRLSPESGRQRFKEGSEDLIRERLLFGLGRWMMVNWGFIEGSRLSHLLKGMGVSHPEQMAEFLLVTYHRYLNNKPLELEERAKIWEELNLRAQEERNKSKIDIRSGIPGEH